MPTPSFRAKRSSLPSTGPLSQQAQTFGSARGFDLRGYLVPEVLQPALLVITDTRRRHR